MSCAETVVLVHGLWVQSPQLWMLGRRLGRHGFAARQFSYRSIARDFDANAERLRAFICEVREPVHLVGHSLGGLLILKALMEDPELPVARVVCLGAPLRGSAVARKLAGHSLGTLLLGKSSGHELLGPDHWEDWDGRRALGIIAGTGGIGVGKLLGPLPAPHDGTVTVAETRLPGVSDFIAIAVTHSGMLFSPAVADQVAHFLRHERFSRD